MELSREPHAAAQQKVADPPAQHDFAVAGPLLYAFYDLEFSPATFDFLSWLLHAEMRRRELGCAGIHVVFVPGCEDNSNPDRYRPSVARWRICNVCIAACSLERSVMAITMCASREAAGEIENRHVDQCFPPGYTTDVYRSGATYDAARMAMADAWLLGGLVVRHLLGNNIPVLRPTGSAVACVRKWLGERAGGRRVVVITLRETQFDVSRNAKAVEWLKFAYSLDPAVYFPVIVQDTEQIFRTPAGFPRLAACTAASLNVNIRAALYEAAFLNLMVCNGPLTLCLLNPAIPYIAYRYFSYSDQYGVIPYGEAYGIPIGGSYAFANELQQLVWDMDNFPIIAATFKEMVIRIEASDATCGRKSLKRRRRYVREELLSIAIGFHRANYLPAAETLYRHLIETDPGDATARAMLGLLTYHRGDAAAAARLILNAIEQRDDVADFFFNLGVVLGSLDRPEEALAAFKTVLRLESEPSGATLANLGKLYRQLGRIEDAIGSYRRAVAEGASDSATLFEFASALAEAGRNAESCDAFAMLRDHYLRNGRLGDERAVKENPALAPLSGIRSAHYVLPVTRERRHLWRDEW